jgi:hypothetical protein
MASFQSGKIRQKAKGKSKKAKVKQFLLFTFALSFSAADLSFQTSQISVFFRQWIQ